MTKTLAKQKQKLAAELKRKIYLENVTDAVSYSKDWGLDTIKLLQKNMAAMSSDEIVFEWNREYGEITRAGGRPGMMRWTPTKNSVPLEFERERLLAQNCGEVEEMTIESVGRNPGLLFLKGGKENIAGSLRYTFRTDIPNLPIEPTLTNFNILFAELIDHVCKYKVNMEDDGTYLKNTLDLFHLNSPLRKMGKNRRLLGLLIPVFIVGRRLTISSGDTEDENFPSVNLLVDGSCVLWIAIHAECNEELIKLVRDRTGVKCDNVLDGKYYGFTPQFLHDNNIGFDTTIQWVGDCIFLAPQIIHIIFNTGICIKVACNFLPFEWGLPKVLLRTYCRCASLCPNKTCKETCKARWREHTDHQGEWCPCIRYCKACKKQERITGESKGKKFCKCTDKIIEMEHGQRLTYYLLPIEETCNEWNRDTLPGLTLRFSALRMDEPAVPRVVKAISMPSIVKKNRPSRKGVMTICKICGKSKSIISIRRHMLTHTDRVRRYACGDCGRDYLTPGVLHDHKIKNNCKVKPK